MREEVVVGQVIEDAPGLPESFGEIAKHRCSPALGALPGQVIGAASDLLEQRDGALQAFTSCRLIAVPEPGRPAQPLALYWQEEPARRVVGEDAGEEECQVAEPAVQGRPLVLRHRLGQLEQPEWIELAVAP